MKISIRYQWHSLWQMNLHTYLLQMLTYENFVKTFASCKLYSHPFSCRILVTCKSLAWITWICKNSTYKYQPTFHLTFDTDDNPLPLQTFQYSFIYISWLTIKCFANFSILSTIFFIIFENKNFTKYINCIFVYLYI